MRKRALLFAALSTAAVTSAVAPNAGAAVSAPAAKPVLADRAARPVLTEADTRAGDVAVAVENMGAFAGIHVDRSDSSIEVFVVRNDAALVAAARKAAGSAKLKFTAARHPYAALKALSDRISKDRDALKAQGVVITHGGVDDTANSVFVGVEGLDAKKAAIIARRYPNQPVRVDAGQVGASLASRIDDNAPWNGGDMISGDGSYNDCSSGPAVQNSTGKRYLLTAGHCFRDSGSSGYVYRVFQGTEGSTLDDPTVMGYAKAENPGYGVSGYDVSMIDTSVSGLVWRTTNPTTVTTAKAQKGTYRAVKDTYVCMSGGFSGERCSGLIEVFDGYYFENDGGKVIHANRAYSSVDILAGHRDSGGPVYQDRTDGVYISGIIQFGIGGGWPCPNMTVVSRPYECYDRVWFGGIGSIMAHTGTSIVIE